eukprot:scaffold59530_cov68-Phaeocystis_antarctica.AAC.3
MASQKPCSPASSRKPVCRTQRPVHMPRLVRRAGPGVRAAADGARLPTGVVAVVGVEEGSLWRAGCQRRLQRQGSGGGSHLLGRHVRPLQDRRQRDRLGAAAEHVAEVEGDALELVGAEVCIVHEHVVVYWVRCPLERVSTLHVEVRLRRADLQRAVLAGKHALLTITVNGPVTVQREEPGGVALLCDEEDELCAEAHALESGPDCADLVVHHVAKLRVPDAVAVEEHALRGHAVHLVKPVQQLHHHRLQLRLWHDLLPLAHARVLASLVEDVLDIAAVGIAAEEKRSEAEVRWPIDPGPWVVHVEADHERRRQQVVDVALQPAVATIHLALDRADEQALQR